jgi:hypothetical protein
MSVRVKFPGPAVTDEHARKEGVIHTGGGYGAAPALGTLTPGVVFEVSDELWKLYGSAEGGSGLLERGDAPPPVSTAAPSVPVPKKAVPKEDKGE